MSEAASAAPSERPSNIARELRVSGRLMTLEPGLFCIVQTPSPNADATTGMPGVRISLPPGPSGRPDAVRIATFREDGWLYGFGDAALVRVIGGPAQVLVTVYQLPEMQGPGPNLQVLRLIDGAAAAPDARPSPGQAQAGAGTGPVPVDMIAHIQGRGDIGAKFGEWLGEQGSKRWIEGFAVSPVKDVAPTDIEYQAVLGRGWLSPWAEGGQFCGSRGMALPVLGLRLRLRGAAAESHECSYSASFVDGTTVGPVTSGEACESEGLAPMEAFRIEVYRRGHAPAERTEGTGSASAEGARPAILGARATAVAAKPPGGKPVPKPKVPIGRAPTAPPRRRT